MQALPLTPNGKLDRKGLPLPDAAAFVARDYEAPEGETEQRLARIWAELLQLERVGPRDNFFELGGDSLAALRLMARVRRVFGVQIGLAALFRRPHYGSWRGACQRRKSSRSPGSSSNSSRWARGRRSSRSTMECCITSCRKRSVRIGDSRRSAVRSHQSETVALPQPGAGRSRLCQPYPRGAAARPLYPHGPLYRWSHRLRSRAPVAAGRRACPAGDNGRHLVAQLYVRVPFPHAVLSTCAADSIFTGTPWPVFARCNSMSSWQRRGSRSGTD